MPSNPVHLNSLADTEELAREVASRLRPGDTLALCGDLGSGKTTFTRCLAQVLGVSVPVSSPTYVLQHEYPTSSGSLLEHWDLYRIPQLPPELEEPTGARSIRIVEWADRFPSFAARATMSLTFRLLDGGGRQAILAPREGS